jgi:hypothetical protein
MSDVRIRTTVTIREVIGERICRATLRNGKMILGYIKVPDRLPPLVVGDRRSVILSLCDFSEGRIVPDDLSSVHLGHPIVEGDPP